MTHPQKEKVKNDESEQIKNVVVMERVSGASKMCDIPFPKIHTKNMSDVHQNFWVATDVQYNSHCEKALGR